MMLITVSATEIVSFLSLRSVATSCTIAFSSSGGKFDEDMLTDRMVDFGRRQSTRELRAKRREENADLQNQH